MNSDLMIKLQAVSFKHQIGQRLKADQAKPSRHKKLRDKDHLTSQVQGQFINKPAQIFLNPTDHQINKIMNGELWGYQP